MVLPGLLIGLESGGVVAFQWNPKTLKKKRQANWKKMSPIGSDIPYAHFASGNAYIYAFEADLTWDRGDVAAYIDALMNLTTPRQLSGTVKRPGMVRLMMGSDIRANGIITNIEAVYGPYFGPTLDTRDGKYSVVFEEVQ